MRYEGAVDIFQTVKMLRTQRPAMVQTEVNTEQQEGLIDSLSTADTAQYAPAWGCIFNVFTVYIRLIVNILNWSVFSSTL